MARAHVFFDGSVQGVFFRANCQKTAVELDLKGWVKNLDDGRVEAVIDGPEEIVKELITWCRRSQPVARVADVEIEWIKPNFEFDDFRILR